MSAHRIPTGGVDARSAFPAHHASKANICVKYSHWCQERLIEARSILADIAHHPDTLVLLACQVISTHGTDPVERADALGVVRLLNVHPSEGVNASPKGGVA